MSPPAPAPTCARAETPHTKHESLAHVEPIAIPSSHQVLSQQTGASRVSCGRRLQGTGTTNSPGAASSLDGERVPRKPGLYLTCLSVQPTYRITKMQKYALSTQQHRRGSSYCSSPIRHCGAFMLPLINPAELFTVPQAAHHHKHPHAQQAAVTQLSNRCDFSQAPQEPAATAGSPAQGERRRSRRCSPGWWQGAQQGAQQ